MPKIFNIDFSATTSVSSVSKPLVSDLNNISYNNDGKSVLVAGRFIGYDTYDNCIVRAFSGGTKDVSLITGLGFNSDILDIKIDSFGNYYIVGNFTTYNNVSANRIIKITSGGTIDNTFNCGVGFNTSVFCLEIQNDGKIVVGGDFTSYNGTSCNRIVRLNTNGTLDNTFSIGTGFDSTVWDIELTNTGLIYAGGTFNTYNGLGYRGVVRLNLDGSVDTLFNTLSGFTSANVRKILIDNSNNVYMGGFFNTYSSVTANNIIKLTPTGNIDISFNTGTGFNSGVVNMSFDSNGDIYVIGTFTTYSSIGNGYMIKLKPDGSKDATFNNSGRFLASNFNSLKSILIDSNGKIIIGGIFTTYSLNFVSNILKLNTDGSVDGSFNYFGAMLQNNSPNVIKEDSQGNLIFVGNFNAYKEPNSLYALNTYDAKKSTTYNPNYGFNASVSSINTQTRALLKSQSGNVYIGGFFENYNQLNSNYRSIAILGTDSGGTGNNLINVNSGANSIINRFWQDPNGGIFFNGFFTAYKGVGVPGFVKINPDASIDGSFNRTGLQSPGTLYRDMSFDSSGNIYLGGSFTLFSSQTNNYIVKLLPNGFKDTSFDNSIGFNNNIITILVDTFGKIIVGGEFTSYKGVTENRIMRLNPDGSKDTTFITTGVNASVWEIKQWNNKYYVVGNFTTYNGVSVNRILRINYDGSIDTTFNVKLGFQSGISPVATFDMMTVDTKGNVYIFSSAMTYQVYNPSFIIKIKPDGSRDVLYNIDTSNFRPGGLFSFVSNLIEL